MKIWLKLIGSASNPIPEWDKEYVGFRRVRKPGIRTGDILFLYAPGARRIFAKAEAVDDPKDHPDYNPNIDGSCRWKVFVRYLIGPLAVASGIPIDDISSQRDWRKSLSQKSHVILRADESQLADRMLREALGKCQEKQSA
jgi:hypothetical protein